MQTTKRTIWLAFLALILITIATAASAGVYKWVDENGNAHYSDNPPDKAKTTSLHIQAAPIQPQVESGNTGTRSNPAQDANQRLLDETNARLKAARELEASKEENRAAQRRIDDQRAAAQKTVDDALTAECVRNRETYCDKGVDRIKQERLLRDIEAEDAQKRRNSNRY